METPEYCTYCGELFSDAVPDRWECTHKHADTDLAMEIVFAILDDLTDRRGLKGEWNMIDSGIQREIRERWAEIIRERVTEKSKGASR